MIERKTIIKELKDFVKKYDTNKLAAAALKVTQSQLSTTINGSVNVIPEKILKRLGYKSELVYVPLKAKKQPAKKGEVKSDDAYLAGITAKTARRQSEMRNDPVPAAVPVAREDDAPVFLDIRERT